ncbi:hypothetical protein K2D_31770 [Planctomycetes bacterium K2D]|uniref:Uncharacterized protein n=1 Tax=Botrimarina mediterranea TaxID=2528022 RepID=A0A518KAV1_9BACT|nr:hypothetical protein Spa11_31260 [Botrimarina mediterranea]QDV79562.1 hypothetical protein K2D_31770 [Planctomycetes bacterium K2D]
MSVDIKPSMLEQNDQFGLRCMMEPFECSTVAKLFNDLFV